MNIRIETPFPPHAWPRVWHWIETFRERVADDFGPKTMETFIEAMLNQPETTKNWAVYRDDELGGWVSMQHVSAHLAIAHCLFKRELWGWETTIPALQAVAVEVFAIGYGKIAMYPLRSNSQIKGVLHKLGARKEGTLRGHTLHNGKPVDMLAYGLTKEEFQKCHH